MSGRYILKDRVPQKMDSRAAWGMWFEKADRVVAKTILPGDIKILTVFLGVDHNYMGLGPPLLFETMVFGGEHDGYQERCSTFEEAEEHHMDAVDLVYDAIKKKTKAEIMNRKAR